MAKILAYDTSTDVLSIAVADGGKILTELKSDSFVRHSEALVPALEKILKSCRMRIADIDVIAVGLGPGSFTGLRVGVTVAKLLAYSLKKNLVGVSGFESLAEGAPITDGTIAMMMDARKSMLYAAVYQKKKKSVRVVLKPRLMRAQDFLEKAKKADWLIGDTTFPKASQIASIAFQKSKKRQWADPFRLEPLYIHPRDCNATKK